MTTAPVSLDELRQLVDRAVAPYGLTVESFLETDIDDLPTVELRDLWLMVKDVLATAA